MLRRKASWIKEGRTPSFTANTSLFFGKSKQQTGPEGIFLHDFYLNICHQIAYTHNKGDDSVWRTLTKCPENERRLEQCYSLLMIWQLGTMSCLRIQINTGDLEINSAVCLQSSKLCLKLDKDNQSKWKMQVLIMISLIKEKKVIQTCTAISKCPLNLITGCSTLGIKNCIQVLVNWQRDFHITVEELWHLFFAGLL